jgi:hypothetical protein
MRHSSTGRIAIVMLLVALGAVACSSGGGDESSGATDVSATTTTPASAPGEATGVTAATATRGITGASAPTGPTSATGSSGPADQPTPVEPDPDNVACQLLTEEVAEPIIGIDLSVAGDVAVGDHSTCVLRDTAETVSVELRITLGRDAQREYDALYASVEGAHGVRVIDGLGDEAFQAVATNDANVLVVTDDTLVRLSTASKGPALARETIELARAIVSNV